MSLTQEIPILYRERQPTHEEVIIKYIVSPRSPRYTPFMHLSPPPSLTCIAHRGASGYEPENTLRSFSRALSLGATWIECDVRLVQNELIVFHDRNLARMTGFSGLVEKQTLSHLRSLTVGQDERVPLLSEVFELIKGRARIQLELKGRGTGEHTAYHLIQLIADGWAPDSFLVSSFDQEEVASFRRLAPTVPVGLLLYGYPLNTSSIARAMNAYSVHLHLETVTPKRVSSLHEEGFKVFVYTVNELSDIEAMLSIGVDGVFTDFPDRVLNFRPAQKY